MGNNSSKSNGQQCQANGVHASNGVDPISVPIHEEKDMKIICIGAGASGLLFAYKLQRSFDKFNLVIYEKNPDVAGTWYENKYPGCSCDVPSHSYTYSFEPKFDWSSVYAGASEIFQYFDGFSKKYDLRKYIKTRHKIVGAQWDDERAKWDVSVMDLANGRTFTDDCDILINAGGVLNTWEWPDIPGLESFEGKVLHSADWDESFDIEGKTVGLIGNGSSAIQILPAIQPKVAHLTTFIRSPTWIAPVGGGTQHIYSEEEKEEFATKPGILLAHRRVNERAMNQAWPIFVRDSQFQAEARTEMVKEMKLKLRNPSLEASLIPTFPVGCRRLTPGPNYLESLTKPNISVVTSGVSSVTRTHVVCDNSSSYGPLDVLICATGFDTTFIPRFPIINHLGQNLQSTWSKSPESYFGIAAPGFPNYMIFLGPDSPIGNGPVLSGVEAQADYILKWIDRWQTDHSLKSFSPSHEAVTDFITWKERIMPGTVWTGHCRSWYKSHTVDGKVFALWPGSTLHYMEALADVRYDDWEIRHWRDKNRFAWLGNGYSRIESDPAAEWCWYVREYDDGPLLGRNKWKRQVSQSGSYKGPQKVTNFLGVDNLTE